MRVFAEQNQFNLFQNSKVTKNIHVHLRRKCIMAVAGLVLGIIALVTWWIPIVNVVALILAIVGLVCSVKGKQQLLMEGRPAGIATAGFVLSLIGLILAAIGFLTCTVCTVCLGACTEEILRELDMQNW